jgi:Protein of unknown function (DUF2950)/Protein of unknown function (DUF3300)
MRTSSGKAKILSLAQCFILVAVTMAFETEGQTAPSPGYAGQGAPLTAEDLQGLVAPIALYPDALVAQILAAATQDKETADAFVAAYGTMNRWRKMDDKSQILVLGVDNFSFPIPLKQNSDGRWYFDTAAGKDEILARRIGRNELAAIKICGALADAQATYHSEPRDGAKRYALKFISDDGKQNGLYWNAADGQPKSPLGPLAAFATAEGYTVQPNTHQPFHGYFFRMLTKQGAQANGGAKDYMVNGKITGGFAFVAYPAEYGNSGVMTFMINQEGILLQKDLGKTTTETASAMSGFNPDANWSPAVE